MKRVTLDIDTDEAVEVWAAKFMFAVQDVPMFKDIRSVHLDVVGGGKGVVVPERPQRACHAKDKPRMVNAIPVRLCTHAVGHAGPHSWE